MVIIYGQSRKDNRHPYHPLKLSSSGVGVLILYPECTEENLQGELAGATPRRYGQNFQTRQFVTWLG